MVPIGLRTVIKAIPNISPFSETLQMISNRYIGFTTFRKSINIEKEETRQKETANVEHSKLDEQLDSMAQKIDKLVKENEDLLDKYKRALAESENMRRRLTKQIQEAKVFGIQSFCTDLLDVADVLSKATETIPSEEIDKNPHLKSLYEGLLMTDAQLKNVFKRNGLEPIYPINEKFNPNFHEALFQQAVENTEPGIVVAVTKVGYKLHERVIRPALVGVSK